MTTNINRISMHGGTTESSEGSQDNHNELRTMMTLSRSPVGAQYHHMASRYKCIVRIPKKSSAPPGVLRTNRGCCVSLRNAEIYQGLSGPADNLSGLPYDT